MVRPHMPLNALRAFEAAARHLTFTNAAIELCVTQGAVSQQVKRLEKQLGVVLFERLPRGLALTQEGETLLPTLRDAFDRIAGTLQRFDGSHYREVLKVGAVGTFAVGWLVPRLAEFRAHHPFIDLRLSTNNNRVDMAAEGLDLSVRFGSGAWHGLVADPVMAAPLSPLCAPRIARRLREPSLLLQETLLRSYRADEWTRWFAAAGVTEPLHHRGGIVFDSSLAMMDAAVQGAGVALAPPAMFVRQLEAGAILRPFAAEIVLGSYWLTYPQVRPVTDAMTAFRDWLFGTVEPAGRVEALPHPLCGRT